MPKIVDHEAYRGALLRDSFGVVARMGYGSLSMKQLAQSLNVSTGLIYHYFASKEEWFVNLVVHFSGLVFSRLAAEVSSDAPLSERARLLVLHVERHREEYANLLSVASDYARIAGGGSQHASVELGMVGDRLYEFLGALFETDETRARALVSHLIGMVMLHRLDPHGIDLWEQLPYIQWLVSGEGSLRMERVAT